MSVVIKINNVDQSDNILSRSVTLSRALTSQIDVVNFVVPRKNFSGFDPANLDDVLIEENGTVIFGGQIVETSRDVEADNLEIVRVTCKDYSYDMDRQMVVNTYENMTIDAIIADINTTFLTGYNITNVDAPVTIGYIAFNYEYPSKCFQQLAELVNYDWYVDESKGIHFFAKSTKIAPFDLTDTNSKYYYNTLKLKADTKAMRNTIVVRGGTFLGSTITEEVQADGNQITFKQAYKYSNIIVKVDSVVKTVGIDFITDPATVDCLYNFNEKAVKFPTATKPTAGQTVSITGEPHIPVIIKLEDPAAVAQYGSFEYKVIDKSINTKQGARDRAQAEIIGWASELNEGSFQTKEIGLAVGQEIRIQSTIRGIDRKYIISRIMSKLTNGQEFVHSVTLITTKTFGMIEFLQNLLIQKDKEIEINQDEVIDVVKTYSESIVFGETITSSKVHNPQTEAIAMAEVFTPQVLNYAVEFVAGEQAPSGFKRQFILDGSRLG